jgi:hypothetical protein
MKVVSLCSKVTLRRGQELFILENANSVVWKIRTIDGDIIEMPALFVEIPPPSEEALEHYGK